MRFALGMVLLLASHVFAQPERYELGKKVHDLEVLWETTPPTEEAKKRATPLINQAVQNFFRFNLSGAAKSLDEARHALRTAEAPKPGSRWADAVAIQPETRIQDRIVTEWKFTAKAFYKADEPMPEKAAIRVEIGRAKPTELPIDKLPQVFTIPLSELPAGTTADYPVNISIITAGNVLATKTVLLSRIDRLDQRLAAIKTASEQPTERPTIETATLIHLHKLLSDLVGKTTPETDYPAAKLITEAESLTKAKEPLYSPSHSGEHWLALPTAKTPNIVRIKIPAGLAKERPVPLVVALHGMGGSENMFFDAYGNGIVPKLANERGWIVVATRVNGLLGAGAAPDVPTILDQLAERYPIDRTKVFLVGHSMGAGHAMLLSQKTPERFAGIAALGGGGKVGQPERVKNVPFFVGCGDQDFALRGAKLMNESLSTTKGLVTFKEYPHIEHLAIVQEAAPDVFRFFDAITKPKK